MRISIHAFTTGDGMNINISRRIEKWGTSYSVIWRRLKKNRNAKIGAFIVLILIIVALSAPLLAPYDPLSQTLSKRLTPPGKEFILGSDGHGRDILSRIIYGSRISLIVGVICVGISMSFGVTIGMIAGFYHRVDNLLMRLMDIMLAFPPILLAIAVMALFDKPDLYKAMAAIGIVYIPQYARIARGSVLQIKEREFIEASRAIGLSDSRIIFSHLLPNIMSPIIVYATLGIGTAIIECAALGFLGLGAQPPTPEWGKMLSDGREYIYSGSWWVTAFPGLAILIVVLGFNLFGDGLRDALDPRLKE